MIINPQNIHSSTTSISDFTVLSEGKYLAPAFNTNDFNDFLVGFTTYQDYVKTGEWHCHINPMISFVLYGHNIEYRKGTSKVRNSGSVDFYHSYEPHKNDYNQFPSKHISVEISKSFLDQYGYSELDLKNALQKSISPQLLLSKIFQESTFIDAHSKESIQIMLLSLLNESKKIYDIDECPTWMKTLKEILHDEWNQNSTLSELSTQLKIHPCTISKYFSRYLNCTLGEYSRKLKIKKSLIMLRNNNMSLTEIAYSCGFSDQSHFTRVFKNYTGYLPKNYRKL